MKYFLTGGGGFIGSTLVRQLTEAGHECVVLSRNPDGVRRSNKALADNPKVTLVQGDVIDKESMRKGMEGCDGVFHLAAWFKVGAPRRETALAEKSNPGGTRNVCELMLELNIPKGVYTSTLAINSDTKGEMVDETHKFTGTHLSVYDRTKWEAHWEVVEPMVKEKKLPMVTVMPGVVYGPGDSGPIHDIFAQFLTGKMAAMPAGTEFCWAHVEDIARAHVLAMDKGVAGETYIICGPRASFVNVMTKCSELSGVKLPTTILSPGFIRTVAAVATPLSYLVPLPADMQPEMLRCTAGTTYIGKNDKAKKELGYEPRSLDEGLKELVDYEMKKLGMTAPAAAAATPAS